MAPIRVWNQNKREANNGLKKKKKSCSSSSPGLLPRKFWERIFGNSSTCCYIISMEMWVAEKS